MAVESGGRSSFQRASQRDPLMDVRMGMKQGVCLRPDARDGVGVAE